MTDGAMVYRRSRLFGALLAAVGARHIVTPPYPPRWNGKVCPAVRQGGEAPRARGFDSGKRHVGVDGPAPIGAGP